MFKRLKTALGKGREPQDSGPSTAAGEAATRAPASGGGGTASRKQLLAIVLRETMLRNAVPSGCLAMEFFRTMDRSGARTDGIHVRLVVRDLHEELAARMVTLERDFRRRVSVIDWQAAEWLQGVSWQLDLPRDDGMPEVAAAAIRPPMETPRASEVPPRQAANDGPVLLSRGRDAREQDAQGRTYASTEPAPL
jgi:hypothetical protein